MSTHNIGFYEEISKIITQLSSNIIKYAPYFFCCLVWHYVVDWDNKPHSKFNKVYNMSLIIRKPTICPWQPLLWRWQLDRALNIIIWGASCEDLSLGFLTRFNTNPAVQIQKMARGLKFPIYEVEGLYYLCNVNKGVDQLYGFCAADPRLCFPIMQ